MLKRNALLGVALFFCCLSFLYDNDFENLKVFKQFIIDNGQFYLVET